MGKNGSKYILDFAFPKEKLNIECDGEYWHETFEKMAVIDNIAWKWVAIASSLSLFFFIAKDLIAKSLHTHENNI